MCDTSLIFGRIIYFWEVTVCWVIWNKFYLKFKVEKI